jgi:hypothetical protein
VREIDMGLLLVAATELLLVRLTFYDPPGTGGGVAAKAFDYGASRLVFSLNVIINNYLCLVSDLLHEAFEVVETCRCKDGCVKCECRNGRGDLSLDATYQVFKVLPVKRVTQYAPNWGLEW